MSFHAPNISKNLLEAVAAVMAEGAAGRMLAKSPTAKKDMEGAGDSTMTYRGKDEKGVYTVKKHRAKGASEYKEVGQRVYEDVEQLDEVEITPAEYRALKSGSVKFDDLAKKKGVSVSTLRGEYSLHDDHMRQGEDHYKKLFKEDEQLDEVELTPAEYRALKSGSIKFDDLAKKKGVSVSTLRGEYYTHDDHMRQGEDHYKKLFKEDEQLDEVSDKLLHNYMRKADRASANWSHNERRAAAGDKDAAARAAKDQKRHAGIDLAKKKLAAKPNTPVKEDVEQVAEGAFSDIDIDRQETKADPKRKADYNKDFSTLLAKHKGAGLDPSERKRLRRLAMILGKKLPGE